jgi:TM2 domain-containing membrane protein YozV
MSDESRSIEDVKLKDPPSAAAMSLFFPGLGQIFNRDFRKGVIFILILVLIFIVGAAIPFIYLSVPILWIYCIYDAYISAKKYNINMTSPQSGGEYDGWSEHKKKLDSLGDK